MCASTSARDPPRCVRVCVCVGGGGGACVYVCVGACTKNL